MAISSLRRVGIETLLLVAVLILSFVFTGKVVTGTGTAQAGEGSGPIAADWTCAGTKFFNSAGVGTIFNVGDAHDGGTFTAIENNNYMEVRDNPASGGEGYIVGEFNQPKRNGDTATITFDRDIHIVSIYWWDNDPDIGAGETGWSFNGTPGPITGDHTAMITNVSLVTNTVTISAGDDSGGVDFCYVEVTGDEGCTPGYWKNHPDAWLATGFATSQTLESVFNVPDGLGLDNYSLLQALSFDGGSGVLGGAKILLRAAVASLLNAAHPDVDYAMTTAEVIADVNAALASGSRATMLALATELDDLNNEGCPLN